MTLACFRSFTLLQHNALLSCGDFPLQLTNKPIPLCSPHKMKKKHSSSAKKARKDEDRRRHLRSGIYPYVYFFTALGIADSLFPLCVARSFLLSTQAYNRRSHPSYSNCFRAGQSISEAVTSVATPPAQETRPRWDPLQNRAGNIFLP